MKARTLLVPLFSLWSLTASAQDVMEVSYPFVDPVAREHFKECFTETTDDELKELVRVKKYAYEFVSLPGCPDEFPDCDLNRDTWFQNFRHIYFSVDEGSAASIRGRLSAAENHSCTDPVDFSGFRYSLSRHQLAYSYHFMARKRTCPFWGGSFEVARAQADVRSQVVLNSDFTLVPTTDVTNVKTKFLGMIDRETFFGLAVAAFGAFPATTLSIVAGLAQLKAPPTDFLNSKVGITGYKKAFEPLSRLGMTGVLAMNFKDDFPNSGFEGAGSGVNMHIIQKGTDTTDSEPNYRAIRSLEMEFLRTLPEVAPKTYKIERGDTLWSIAKKNFGDPRLYLVLAEYMDLKAPGRLAVGQEVKIPRWYEICKILRPSTIVTDGETIWGKRKAGQLPSDLGLVQVRSGNDNMIFPYENLKVRETLQ